MLTYSTKPRGGVVHSLELAEALMDRGVKVHLFGLGKSGESFFRPTKVPFTLFPSIDDASTLDEKVFASVDSMAAGLRNWSSEFDVFHAQDCISARAATRIRDNLAHIPVIRTVHHIDDFTTAALMDCQRQAIIEPDHILVVSQAWQETIRAEFHIGADIVANGVRPERFAPISAEVRSSLRDSLAVGDRTVLLAVGGIEPRKGSHELFQALGILKSRFHNVVLVIIGAHSFQDYEAYRQAGLNLLPSLDLELGRDIVQLGTVDEKDLARWFRAADILVYPSRKEGFGLVPLEALAADLPVIASSIPVFREFLVDRVSALLPEVGNPLAIANAVEELVMDATLRAKLIAGGRLVVPKYSWGASALRHEEIYRKVINSDA